MGAAGAGRDRGGPARHRTTLVRLLDPGAPQAAATNVDTFGITVAG